MSTIQPIPANPRRAPTAGKAGSGERDRRSEDVQGRVRVSFGPIIKIADALGVRVRDLIDL